MPHFGDFGELLTLNATWLLGYKARHVAGLTEAEHSEMWLVDLLLGTYVILKEDNFSSANAARHWLRAVAELVPRLWD